MTPHHVTCHVTVVFFLNQQFITQCMRADRGDVTVVSCTFLLSRINQKEKKSKINMKSKK